MDKRAKARRIQEEVKAALAPWEAKGLQVHFQKGSLQHGNGQGKGVTPGSPSIISICLPASSVPQAPQPMVMDGLMAGAGGRSQNV